SALDGIPRSRFLRQPSLCRARLGPSPPFRGPISKKYLQSASRTAYQFRAPAAARSCPPLPSTHQSTFPTSRRRLTLAALNPSRPQSCRQETDSSSATRVLPVPPAPTIPRLPPCRTCSKTPQSPAHQLAEPAKCARAFAASVHPSPPQPESLRPSAPRR